MNGLNERLKLIRKYLGLTQKEMANIMGVSLRVYQYYEKGEQKPSYDKLIPLIEKFNINGTWLLTGQGEMFLSEKGTKNIGLNYGGMQIGNIIAETVGSVRVANHSKTTTSPEEELQDILKTLQEIKNKSPEAYQKVVHKLKQEAQALKDLLL